MRPRQQHNDNDTMKLTITQSIFDDGSLTFEDGELVFTNQAHSISIAYANVLLHALCTDKDSGWNEACVYLQVNKVKGLEGKKNGAVVVLASEEEEGEKDKMLEVTIACTKPGEKLKDVFDNLTKYVSQTPMENMEGEDEVCMVCFCFWFFFF